MKPDSLLLMVTPILTLESIFLHRKVTVKQSFLFKWREPIIGDAESLKQLALPWIMWKAYRIPVVFPCFLKIQKGLQRLCFTTAFREVCSSMKLVKYSFSRCILCIYAANVYLILCGEHGRVLGRRNRQKADMVLCLPGAFSMVGENWTSNGKGLI